MAQPAAATPTPSTQPQPLFSSFTLEGLAEYINTHNPKNILLMIGAGASVAAGIPDFRSPGVGLYSKLAAMYPELARRPEALFELDTFKAKPELFYTIMNEMNMWPESYQPTTVHRFIKLLQDKGLLLRCFTQNIDTLERIAGVKSELVVEAHGAFSSAHCVSCKAERSMKDVETCAKAGGIPTCKECGNLVKPDVIFFGEALPQRFFELARADSSKCDLLIIIGTSLKVYPFALLPSFVENNVPRVLINMTRAGDRTFVFQSDANGLANGGAPRDENEDDTSSSTSSEGPNATPLSPNQLGHCYRDLLLQGDCQVIVKQLVDALGWQLPSLEATDTANVESSKQE